MVVKAVTNRVLGRDEILKILKGRFQVAAQSLRDLTVSQLTETLARKFMERKYVVVTEGADFGDLKRSQVSVHREVEILNFFRTVHVAILYKHNTVCYC